MGLSSEEAERSIRVSFHAESTAADVAVAVPRLARVVKELRALHA
jgi:cysteine sulfinate desulfinase/cysteine desulfurase-like protein